MSIADREADIDDIFVEAHQQTGPRADDIIRAQEDRSTLERDPDAGPAASVKVRDEVSRSKLRTTRTIELSQTPTRLGGDNNRATEAPPGPQPLWIGLRRTTDFGTAWLAFGPQDGSSCVSATGVRVRELTGGRHGSWWKNRPGSGRPNSSGRLSGENPPSPSP